MRTTRSRETYAGLAGEFRPNLRMLYEMTIRPRWLLALLRNGYPRFATISDYANSTNPNEIIKFARARGLTDRAIHFGHALKNTLVPVITITGLQLGGIIAFAIVTETVFQWPGMGLLFIQAVTVADVPVMAAYLCLIALFFVVINLVVDLLYYAVDPRLRLERAAAH